MSGFVSAAALGAAVLASSPALAQTQTQATVTSAHATALTKGMPGPHHCHKGGGGGNQGNQGGNQGGQGGDQNNGGLLDSLLGPHGLLGSLLGDVQNLLSGL